MAAIITTKFYANSTWNDLAKIVFTSPNMDSPNTAGTRSHILPGQLDLALWYEDTSSMYIVESDQHEYTSTYFGYSAELKESIDLDNPPLSMSVISVNQNDWLEFIRSEVDIGGNSYPVVYKGITLPQDATYTVSSGTTASGAFGTTGCTVAATYEDHWLELSLFDSIRPTRISFQSVSEYEAKYFKIQGLYDTTLSGSSASTLSGINWIDLYDGTTQDTKLDYSTDIQTFNFSNISPLTNVRFVFYSKWAASNGYSMQNCSLFKYDTDESVTNTKPIYVAQEKVVYVTNVQLGVHDDELLTFEIDHVDGAGIIPEGATIAAWGWPGGWGGNTDLPDVNTQNSVVFEITIGEAYDCRLTAWDDVTHATTINTLISTDRCRVSCVAFNANGTPIEPTENEGVSFIHPPVLNKIFKGNVSDSGYDYYYGDFDLLYRTGAPIGDYLIFKPMLYDVDNTVPYGVHDFIIALSYSYT